MSLHRVMRSAPVTVSLAVITALALIFVSELSYNRSIAAMRNLDSVVATRLQVQQILRLMLDAETGQRGYLLTGNTDYLKPYVAATRQLGSTLSELGEHYKDQPQSLAEFTQLAQLIAQKLSEMETVVRLRQEGREAAWRSVLETDIGREQMALIRHAADTLVVRDTDRIEHEHRQVSRTLLIARVGIAAMTTVSVLALLMYLRQGATLEQERAQRQASLQRERDSLEQQVRHRTQALTQLAQHLQTAREDERSRLARELHDELGALLTAAKLDVARLQSRLPGLSAEASERIVHLNSTLNSGIALKRRIIEDLRPSSLSNLGLVAALEILTQEYATRSGQRVRTSLEPVPLSPSGELTVYRLVQEALTNIAKYAQAGTVDVTLRGEGDRVEIAVQDDGRGFRSEGVDASAHGLLGMRYRVEAEGGEMHIDSRPARGTRLSAWLPKARAVAKSDAGPMGEAA
jgi:signal transduction histidine kinase